jgi:hypothetical protein
MDELHNQKRSPEWPKVMHDYLSKHPACEACGKVGAVNVHHVAPFEFIINFGRPELELDENNLITLCESESGKPEENHHIEIGHAGDFKKANLNVRQDASRYYGETLVQLKENTQFMEEIKANALPPLDQLTPEQKTYFQNWLDTTYPKK